MARPGLPSWLRRGLEAALVATVVAVASLLGNGFASGPPRDLPGGLLGATILAPGVLSLSVVTTAYPIAMAATRADAILGSVAAFLVAGDLTLILAGAIVRVPAVGIDWPMGLVAAAVALLPALAGLAGGQLATPFGFGRRAGAWAAATSGIAAVVVLGTVAGMS